MTPSAELVTTGLRYDPQAGQPRVQVFEAALLVQRRHLLVGEGRDQAGMAAGLLGQHRGQDPS